MNIFNEQNGLPLIDNEGIHGTPMNCYMQVDMGDMQPWTTYVVSKTPREQLLEEIMVKAHAALQENNLDRVRELLEIGSMLKEI